MKRFHARSLGAGTLAQRDVPLSARECVPLRARGSVPLRSRAGGFTLAEVAVTIVIVGIGLVLVLQGLNVAKIAAAQTRNQKLARSLALVTLGQVESGIFQEDIDSGLKGAFTEEGYPEFAYEVLVGDATFREKNDDGTYDSFAPTESEQDQKDKDDEEEIEEPFEKVKIRITFPKIREYSNELVLERWIPWKQVYGETEETDAADGTSGTSSGTQTASSKSSSSTKK